jgi:hypothetical protein
VQDKRGYWYTPRTKKPTRHEQFKKLTTAKVRKELKEADDAKCCERERLMEHVVKDDATGCLVWQGPWKENYGKVLPFMTAGRHGSMWARRAMWLCEAKKPYVDPWYPIMECGNEHCVNPDHMILTNRVLERAKKKLGYPK